MRAAVSGVEAWVAVMEVVALAAAVMVVVMVEVMVEVEMVEVEVVEVEVVAEVEHPQSVRRGPVGSHWVRAQSICRPKKSCRRGSRGRWRRRRSC